VERWKKYHRWFETQELFKIADYWILAFSSVLENTEAEKSKLDEELKARQDELKELKQEMKESNQEFERFKQEVAIAHIDLIIRGFTNAKKIPTMATILYVIL